MRISLKRASAVMLCLLALSVILLTGCGGKGDPHSTPSETEGEPSSGVSVTDIVLNKSELSLVVGGSETLTATVEPSTATDKSVAWSTSDPSVADVSDGRVTAVGGGRATVTATASNGASASCTVNVEAPVESISLDKTSLTLTYGEVKAIDVIFVPASATDREVIWTSSDESVAVVMSGKVMGVSGGVATVTATTANGKTASCEVTVISTVVSVSLDRSTLKLSNGDTATLKASIFPYNATDGELTWSTSDASVVTVSGGELEAVGAGVATVTVSTANGKTASCEVSVSMYDLTVIGATQIGKEINVSVGSSVASYQVGFNVILKGNVTYSVSSDENGEEKIGENIPLSEGDNVFYLSVIAEGNTDIYKVTVHRKFVYTVHFDANGGTPVESQRVEEGGFLTVPDTTRKRYEFAGWYYGDQYIDLSKPWPFTEDVTLKAHWNDIVTAQYRVLHYFEDPKGGYSLEKTEISMAEVGAQVTPPVINREGYESIQTQTATVTPDGLLTIKYYYPRRNYTVTFVTNGGYEIPSKSITFGQAFVLPDAVRPGYTFYGWYSDEKLSNKATWNTMPAFDLTLYAYWNEEDKPNEFEYIVGANSVSIVNMIYNPYKSRAHIPSYIGGKPVTHIHNNALSGAKNITTLVLPEHLQRIGDYAFCGCKLLVSVTIPDSVISIGDYAFYDCINIYSMIIGSGVTSIGKSAFDFRGGEFRLYYKGTDPSQWTDIYGIKEYYSWLEVFCYSAERPTDTENGYWRYVDDSPRIWTRAEIVGK